MRCPRTSKSKVLSVTQGCIGDGRAVKEVAILPSEGPSITNRCNYDIESSNRHSNVTATNRGPADEVVVVVKPGADESVVMHLRIKLQESGGKKTLEAKDRTR